MKILITGGTGMVGQHLLPYLQSIGRYTLLTPARSQVDLLQKSSIDAYLKQHKPDCIIHLAAKVGGILANTQQPSEFLMQNIQIGLNVVNSAHEHNVPSLLNIASSCMYPKGLDILNIEDILQGPLEPTNEGYALAKLVVAKYCSYLNQQYDRHYVTLIPCNLYGEFDNFDPASSHLIPGIITKMCKAIEQEQATITLWGTGEAKREFMHALDLARFIEYSLRHITTLPDFINVGYGADYTVREYYEIAARIIGFTGVFDYDPSKPTGMLRKLMNSDHARNLGWKPEINIEEGMKRTYEYYQRSHHALPTSG